MNPLNAYNITYWALLYQKLHMHECNDPNNGMVYQCFSYFINQETKGKVR